MKHKTITTKNTLLLLSCLLLSTTNTCQYNSAQAKEPYQLETKSDDIALTDDITLAKAQVLKFPDNAEAHFNLAIALSRTSAVEETIQELRTTKKMILNGKDLSIIDKKIAEYEQMLKNDTKATNIRYRLAFSHYLKAYFLTKERERAENKAQWALVEELREKGKKAEAMALRIELEGGPKNPNINLLDSDKLSLKVQDPNINKHIQKSITYFEDILKRDPNDIWSKIYYAFIVAEQQNDYKKANRLWHEARAQDPNNPAPHFFIGESLLKEGNLKEGLSEISKALILRTSGK